MIDPRLMRILVCPRCHSGLKLESTTLFCGAGHEFPVVEGIPVFVIPEVDQTIRVALESYHAAKGGDGGPLYLETLGLSKAETIRIERQWAKNRDTGQIDPVISYLVGATCGLGYAKLSGRMTSYPIPRIPVGPGDGQLLLDLGCNWGRWSIAAARNGWRVIGIDPSLGAIVAARRAFKDAPEIMFVCGDARFLPFRSDSFRCAFSYSVLQHFSETDAERALAEVARVLQPNGYSHIQMAHRGGLRARFVLAKHADASGGIFDVRRWSLRHLRRVFSEQIGPSALVAEAFGGLGLLFEDWPVVSVRAKLLLPVSALLKKLARYIRPLILLADSIYVVSTKR